MITKIGQQFDDSAFTEDTGFIDAQSAMQRAIRARSKGVGQFLADPDLITSRLKRGLGYGAAGSLGTAVAAALLSGGRPEAAGLGALLGGTVGMSAGAYTADRDFLRKRGINPRMLGLTARLTPEAKARYLGSDT